MTINTKVRIRAGKRIYRNLLQEYRRRNEQAFGFADPYETYVELEYWEQVLKDLGWKA